MLRSFQTAKTFPFLELRLCLTIGRLLPLRCGALPTSLLSNPNPSMAIVIRHPEMAAYNAGRFARSHSIPPFGNKPGTILYHSNALYTTLSRVLLSYALLMTEVRTHFNPGQIYSKSPGDRFITTVSTSVLLLWQ